MLVVPLVVVVVVIVVVVVGMVWLMAEFAMSESSLGGVVFGRRLG